MSAAISSVPLRLRQKVMVRWPASIRAAAADAASPFAEERTPVTSSSTGGSMSANRRGLTLGEGAAVFLVTGEEGGVQLAGVGESSEAHHMSAPDPEGRGAETAMREALATWLGASAEGEGPDEDPAQGSALKFILRRMRRNSDFPAISAHITEIRRKTTLDEHSSVGDVANVIIADIEASNGVIHVIDKVLLPGDRPACH